MNAELMDLGRRAVACKSWRWMQGMLAVTLHDEQARPEFRWTLDDTFTPSRIEDEDDARHYDRTAEARDIPDLSDAATLGCLLALVREVHADPRLHCYTVGAHRWSVASNRGDFFGAWPTEAGVLVYTLEAAP